MNTRNHSRLWSSAAIIGGLVLFVLLAARFLRGLDEGSPGYSSSIEKSKENQVFVAEFHPNKAFVQIGANEIHFIGQIWAERTWSMGPPENPVILPPDRSGKGHYTLYIQVSEEDCMRYISQPGTSELLLMRDGIPFGTKSVGKRHFLAGYYDRSLSNCETLFVASMFDSSFDRAAISNQIILTRR